MSTLALEKIKLDGGTQSRAAINDAVVEDYAQVIRDGSDLPPIVVFHDGKKYWLADGFHRVSAYKAAGAVEIEADVRQGDRRDAILYSVGANAAHGLRRTNDDKRRAVMTLLNDKEWVRWSDREIARQCQVGHPLVGKLRAEFSPYLEAVPDSRTVKRGDSTFSMGTANIGKVKPSAEQQAEFEAQRQAHEDRLPDSIKASIAAQEERAKSKSGQSSEDPETLAGQLNDKIETLLEQLGDKDNEITELNGKLEEAKARLATFDDMVASYEKGGFEAVIEGLKEDVRVAQARTYSTNEDIAKWMKKARFEESEKLRYKAAAERLGYSDNVDVDDIDPETGAIKK